MAKKPYDFILPKLAVGSFESRLDSIFDAVLTLITPEEIRYINQTFPITTPAKSVLHIPIRDGVMGITPYLEEGFKFIDDHLKDDKTVLVHCHAGISRSPSMATYYLCKKEGVHPIDALKRIKKARPIVDPYSGFIYEIMQKFIGDKLPLKDIETPSGWVREK